MPSIKPSVIHVALNPFTGPLSVMRDLAIAQSMSGLYSSVAIGVIHSRKWPAHYDAELLCLNIAIYKASTLEAPGTIQFLWQRIKPPPIDDWIKDVLMKSGANRCIIHFHNAWMSGTFLPLSSVLDGRASVVVTFHGVNSQLNKHPMRHKAHQWMAARLVRYGACLTSVDKTNLSLAESLLKLKAQSFIVIPNGVPSNPVLNCNLWTGKGEFRVGHVGSITARKGWRFTAEAVIELRRRGVNIRMLIAGNGDEESSARELKKAFPDAIEVLGHVNNPRQNLLPRLHVLTLMSVHEGLPMSIIEAMSVGLPVVATDVGGIPEAVINRISGVVVSRSTSALVNVLLDIYNNKTLWLALSRGARIAFEKQFDIDFVVKKYHETYIIALGRGLE